MFSYAEASNIVRQGDAKCAARLDCCLHVVHVESCLTPHPGELLLDHTVHTSSRDDRKVTDPPGTLNRSAVVVDAEYWSALNAIRNWSLSSMFSTAPSSHFETALSSAHAIAINLDGITNNINDNESSDKHKEDNVTHHAQMLNKIAIASSRDPSLRPVAIQLLNEFAQLLSRIRQHFQAQAIALKILPSLLQSPLPLSAIDLLRPFCIPRSSHKLIVAPFIDLLDSPDPHVSLKFLFTRISHHDSTDMIILFRSFIGALYSLISKSTTNAPTQLACHLACIIVLFDTVSRNNWYHPRDDQSPQSIKKKQRTENTFCPKSTTQIVRSLFVTLVHLLSKSVSHDCPQMSLTTQVSNAVASVLRFSVEMVDCDVPSLISTVATMSGIHCNSRDGHTSSSITVILKQLFVTLLSSYTKAKSLPLLLHHITGHSSDVPAYSAFAKVLGAHPVSLMFSRMIFQLPVGGAQACVQSLKPATSELRSYEITAFTFIVCLVLESTNEMQRHGVMQCVLDNVLPMLVRIKPCVERRASLRFLGASLIFAGLQNNSNEACMILPALFRSGFFSKGSSSEYYDHESNMRVRVDSVESIVSFIDEMVPEPDEMVCIASIRFLSSLVYFLLRQSICDFSSLKKHATKVLRTISSHFEMLMTVVPVVEGGHYEAHVFWDGSPLDTAALMLLSVSDALDLVLNREELSHVLVLVLNHWMEHSQKSNLVWENLLERKHVHRVVANVVCTKVQKHIQTLKIGTGSTNCNPGDCPVALTLKFVRAIPAGYFGKSDELAVRDGILSLYKWICCIKSHSELLMIIRDGGICPGSAMMERNDISDSNYLMMLCVHPDHSFLRLVHSVIECWSEAWPDFQTTELAKILNSSVPTEWDPEKRYETILVMAMDYVLGKLGYLKKRCLLILNGAGSNVEEQKCVLRTVGGVLDIEDGLRNDNRHVKRIWRQEVCCLIDKLIGPATLFCMKKVVESQMLEESTQVLKRCCRYIGSESPEDVFPDRCDRLKKSLSRIVGWMIFLLQHKEDRFRHVGMQMAYQCSNTISDKIATALVQLVRSGDQYVTMSERRWKTELLHLLVTGRALQANVKLRLELLHVMLNLSYMGFVADLTAPTSTAVALNLCTMSIRSCENVLRQGGKHLRNELCLESVLIMLGRLMHSISFHIDACTGDDCIHLLTGIATACIILFRQGGLSVKWACVKLACSLVRFGATFGGDICGEAVASLLRAIGWGCRTQKFRTEVAQTLTMASALGIVESGCSEFESRVVKAIASVIYNSSMNRQSFGILLSHASPAVTAVLQKSKHLANLMAYQGK